MFYYLNKYFKVIHILETKGSSEEEVDMEIFMEDEMLDNMPLSAFLPKLNKKKRKTCESTKGVLKILFFVQIHI